MHMNEYQDRTTETAVYVNLLTLEEDRLNYCIVGLCGEVGEIANKWKKVIRDNGGKLNDAIKEDLLDESGDALYYLSRAIRHLGGTLDEVAMQNLEKLADRKSRGAIHGSGDSR